MVVNAKTVAQLRERTGAGMMACKEALAAEGGNLERAAEYLRKKGLAAASKKAGRVATEGAVGAYIHAGGKIGVMVEINAETDFVGRNDDFQGFVRDVAMHVAAASPRYVHRQEVPAEEVERERAFLAEQIRGENKPEAVATRMLEGRIDKFYAGICLLEQPFVKDPSRTIEQVRQGLSAKIGEKIDVRRFVRFALGEGMQKRQEDFAQEVQKVAAGG